MRVARWHYKAPISVEKTNITIAEMERGYFGKLLEFNM